MNEIGTIEIQETETTSRPGDGEFHLVYEDLPTCLCGYPRHSRTKILDVDPDDVISRTTCVVCAEMGAEIIRLWANFD